MKTKKWIQQPLDKKAKKQSDFLESQFQAKEEQLPDVMDFVEQELEKEGCPSKTRMQLLLCVEEIFVNIAKYAYIGQSADVTVGIDCEGQEWKIQFTDHGIPFNPLNREAPDITLSADERTPGGLGIYLVKKTMDAVNYEYKNRKNILTITKMK